MTKFSFHHSEHDGRGRGRGMVSERVGWWERGKSGKGWVSKKSFN